MPDLINMSDAEITARLVELLAKAAPGRWQTYISGLGMLGVVDSNFANVVQTQAPDTPKDHANIELIAALVNLYRAGRLTVRPDNTHQSAIVANPPTGSSNTDADRIWRITREMAGS